MAFFDTFSQQLSNKGSQVIQKAKDYAGVSELEAAKKRVQQEISVLFSELGERVYNNLKTETNSSLYKEQVEVINSKYAEIEKLQDQILTIKNQKRCPACGNIIDEDTSFCPKCGQAIQKETQAEAINLKHCKNCGALLNEGSSFCTSCGSKVEE